MTKTQEERKHPKHSLQEYATALPKLVSGGKFKINTWPLLYIEATVDALSKMAKI